MSSQVLTVPGLEDWVVEEDSADVRVQLDDGVDWLTLTLQDYDDDEPLVVRSETVVAVKPL